MEFRTWMRKISIPAADARCGRRSDALRDQDASASRPACQEPSASSRLSVRQEEDAAVPVGHSLRDQRRDQVSQVVFSQLAAAVDSLWVVPGFGQLAGAVMSRMGIVMIEFGSQTGKSYLGSFFVMPITVSL